MPRPFILCLWQNKAFSILFIFWESLGITEDFFKKMFNKKIYSKKITLKERIQRK